MPWTGYSLVRVFLKQFCLSPVFGTYKSWRSIGLGRYKALILTNGETRCCIIMSELSRRRWANRFESTFKKLQKIDIIWANANTANVPIDKNDRDIWLINSEIIIVSRRSPV
jgi:hypothetical protein